MILVLVDLATPVVTDGKLVLIVQSSTWNDTCIDHLRQQMHL